MKVSALNISGAKESEVELPLVFSTPFRNDLIVKAFTNLNSHKFQPQGRHPTAGMDVVARSNDPPTGQGRSRIAKMRGGGGGRQGEAGGVASVKGGRQAHPPKVQKVIIKKLCHKCITNSMNPIKSQIRSDVYATNILPITHNTYD